MHVVLPDAFDRDNWPVTRVSTLRPKTLTPKSQNIDPFLGVSVKVNLNSEIGRFGLIVRVGGTPGGLGSFGAVHRGRRLNPKP